MSLVTALEAPLSISNAIRKASKATGANFSYLLKTAARESAFNKSAKAKTSSAAGLFQFIESTWLQTVKDVGDKFGLRKYTPHIFKTRSGRYYVPNEKLRQEILQLRHNPEVSAMMAGAFTQQNADFVAEHIGRDPTQGELYIAHFLGAKGAADLISLNESKPNARADRHFPRAARANQSIFYSRGKPRSVAQLYKSLVGSHMRDQATAAASAKPPAPEPAVAREAVSAQLSRPVANPEIDGAPARQVTPTQEDLKRLVHTASTTPPPPAPSGSSEAVSLAPGVEAKIIESREASEAIGLLGQKGSPVVSTARVAALTHNNLGLPKKTMTDAPTGSIGTWTTIVHESPALPPAASIPSGGGPERSPAIDESAKTGRTDPVARRKQRAPRLLEESAARNAPRPEVRTRSRSDLHWDNLWAEMSARG